MTNERQHKEANYLQIDLQPGRFSQDLGQDGCIPLALDLVGPRVVTQCVTYTIINILLLYMILLLTACCLSLLS